MKSARRKKLMWGWALVSAGAISLFWTTWYLTTGSVPVVSQIRWTEAELCSLPFGVSRWWDVLIGPVWSTIIISLFIKKKIQKNGTLFAGLIAGVFAGLIAGLGFAAAAGLLVSLLFGLFAHIPALVCSSDQDPGFLPGFSLGFGLTFGLCAGLWFGPGVSLIIGTTILVAIGLDYLSEIFSLAKSAGKESSAG